jgi:hypothetical protein
MNKMTLLSIAATAILYGCGDDGFLAPKGASPKLAAELCHAWTEGVAPTESQAKVVAAYQAGEIPFEECMRRLRE